MRYTWLIILLFLRAAGAQSSDIAKDERIVLFPTFAQQSDDGETWSISVHGWIFEDQRAETSVKLLEGLLGLDDEIKDPAQRKLLRQRLGAFVVDNERHKDPVIVIGAHKFVAAPSAKNGHFRQQVVLPVGEVERIRKAQGDPPGRLTFRIATRPDDPRTFAGRLHLLAPHGLSVISDIDDTIRVTNVRDRKAMLVNTLLLPYRPVPGIADVYTHWARHDGAEFHYVSASPYQLYEPLAEFMTASGFPEGTFHLKMVRVMDRTIFDLFDSAEEYKPGQIEPILQRYPRRTFVCVGDSSEQDPEVYGALARKYPQIRRIFIRDLNEEGPDAPRYAEAFRGLPAGTWKVFKDPAEIRELGLTPATSTAPAAAGG